MAIPTATVMMPAAAPVIVQQSPSYVPPPVGMQTMPVAVTTQKASFVAPPAMQTMAVAPQQFPMAAQQPMPPQQLTKGIPDPQAIESQKRAYAAALDKQLKEAMDTVIKETAIEKRMAAFKTEKDVALFELSVDEKLAEQMALVDEQATMAQCQLKKALVDRNVQLNSQASGLVAEYKMKAMMDDLAKKKAEFERAYIGKEMQLAQQYQQEAAKANTGTTYAVPGGQAVPQYTAPASVATPAYAPAQYAVAAAPAAQYAVAAPPQYAQAQYVVAA